jgi:hypothetical protein
MVEKLTVLIQLKNILEHVLMPEDSEFVYVVRSGQSVMFAPPCVFSRLV